MVHERKTQLLNGTGKKNTTIKWDRKEKHNY